MENQLLGRALGRCVSSLGGLNAIYVPAGVSIGVAEALVHEANLQKQLDPPFAILVSETAPLLDSPSVVRVWPPEDVIKYRQGARLAVVAGRHTDFQSIASSFSEVLGLSYPALASGPISISQVALESATLVIEAAGVSGASRSSIRAAARRLEGCLSQLSEIYESSRLGELGWNAYWFDHINSGLNRLTDQLKCVAANQPSMKLDDAFERYTFAAFGMPNPGKGKFRVPGSTKAYASAVNEWWIDSATVEATVAHLRYHPDTSGASHELESLGWSDYDRQIAVVGHPLIGLMRKDLSVSAVCDSFAALSPRQFFDPTNRAAITSAMTVSGLTGEDFGIGDSAEIGPFVVVGSFDDDAVLVSEDVRIKIPTLTPIANDAVSASGVTLTLSPAVYSWDGELVNAEDGELWAVGKISRRIVGRKAKPLGVITVRIALPINDPLAGAILRGSSCVVHFVPAQVPALTYYRLTNSQVVGPPGYLGPAILPRESTLNDQTETDGSFVAEIEDAKESLRVIVWSDSDDAQPLHNGRGMSALKSRTGLFSVTLRPSELDLFAVGDNTFELKSAEPTSSLQSPIVAAIGNEEVSGSRPKQATTESLRGILESTFAANLDEPEWDVAHGHVVIVSTHDQIPVSDLRSEGSAGAFLMNPLTRSIWEDFVDEEVPRELLDSEEARAFRQAFADLGIRQSLLLAGDLSAVEFEWPSRTSWRHLWREKRLELDSYLSTYADLVAKAKKVGSQLGIFWATYPYSASVWKEEGAFECSAVLVSPLHPVRLAWLASVESTLWDSKYARELAGTVEGWNFPLFGPRHTTTGYMVAMPMDTGEGQVFLGWSMLVAAAADQERPLIAPHRVGPYSAPGTATSGLNATAATSALRSYRRMHPHVATLTVDLAASGKTARLTEVDEAVLAQLEAWASEKSGRFRGGARVLDSTAREGAVPLGRVAELAQKHPNMPILWSRYVPKDVSETCNIRLLQDSGVAVVVRPGTSENLGVLAPAPLRRFEASEASIPSAKRAKSRPAIVSGRAGWKAFERALGAIEFSTSQPEITSRIHKTALADDRADWTVSGESLLSPSAMASLMQGTGKGEQMLWEWRPPFLEAATDVPVLERRPFVSVARVPSGFRRQLTELLERSTGAAASDRAVSALLNKLGARGVGLSSLLAMGGTQAAGALGFFLSFALTEVLRSDDDVEYMALPIDACDTFLRALAGGDRSVEKTRRADILLLRIDDSSLTLLPIEIKFQGSDGDASGGRLPGANDATLSDARDQLRSTTALLRLLAVRGSEVDAGPLHDKLLWRNALGALVEAAIRLKPAGAPNTVPLASRLRRVIDGSMPLRIGIPIVNYFKHDAYTADGRDFEVTRSTSESSSQNQFGALVANSGASFRDITDPQSAIAEAWRDLVDWTASAQPQMVAAVEDVVAAKANVATELVLPQTEAGGRGDPIANDDLVDDESLAEPTPLDNAPSGIKFPVGVLSDAVGSVEAEFWPGNTALNQMNVGVVGDLGTGKTQLTKTLIYQLRAQAKATQANPLTVLIFDYKNDFQDEKFLDAVGGRVLSPHRIPLNIFALDVAYSPRAAFLRASSFFDTIAKIYPGVGAVQRDRLVTVITDLYRDMDGVAPTLAEVRERYLALGRPDSVTSILNTFVLGEIFSDDRSELKSFDELIQDTVLVVDLNSLGVDQNSKNSLVALFLNVYYDFMRRSKKWPFRGSDPQLRQLNSFLVVDEAVNIMRYEFGVLMDLMLQGREFGFGTLLSSQYLSHFRTSSGVNYGEPLLTWFIHKVPNVTYKQLESLGIPGATAESADRIASLQNHDAYYSSLNVPGRFIHDSPFFKLVPGEA